MRYLISSALICALWAGPSPLVGTAAGEEPKSSQKSPVAKPSPAKPSPATLSPGKSPLRVLPEPSEAERKIVASLGKPADVDWVETPLGDVVAQLSEKYALPIQLDVAALAADGKSSETPISKKISGVSLKQVLRATLNELGLTYVVRFDQLTVTTKSAASMLVRTRIYPVHDLVVMPGDTAAARIDTRSLVEVLKSSIAPLSWTEHEGNAGIIRPYDGNGVIGLIITQTDEIHGQIEELFAALRAAQADPVRQAQARQAESAKPAGTGRDGAGVADARAAEQATAFPPGAIYPQPSEAEGRLETLLGKGADVEWIETPLADVLIEFREKYGLPIQIDTEALAADGVGLDRTVSKSVRGITVRSLLRLVLEEHGLTYDFRNDQLLITTRHAAEQLLSTRVYQVHDLVVMPDDPSASRPDTEPLIEMITSMIAPETWREAGGTAGEIREFVGNGVISLVVTQNRVGHEWLESLLEAVRDARSDAVRDRQAGKPGETGAALTAPVPYYPQPLDEDRRIAAALEQPADFQWVETRLDDVAAEIAKKYALPIQVDAGALAADGKGGDEVQITKTFRKTSLRNVLNATLREQGLALVVGEEPLRITTRTAAETMVLTRIYPVADLISMPGRVPRSRGDDEPLVRLIIATVDPETWRYHGGTQGEMKEYVGNGVVALAITQTEDVHEKIVQLLAALRAARSESLRRAQGGQAPAPNAPNAQNAPKPPHAPAAPARVYPEPTAGERRIAAALAKPADIQWLDTQLGDVALYLAEKYELSVQLDLPALAADGKGSETLINQSARGISLDSGLRSALDEQGLTYVVVYDQLLITTKTAAEMFGSVRIYPVDDLAVMPNDPAAKRPNLGPLVESIETTVLPEGRRAAGGTPGEIKGYAGPGVVALAIHQTDEGHAEIARLLSALRLAQSDTVREAQSRRRLGPLRVDNDDDSSAPQPDPKPAAGGPAEKPQAEQSPAAKSAEGATAASPKAAKLEMP